MIKLIYFIYLLFTGSFAYAQTDLNASFADSVTTILSPEDYKEFDSILFFEIDSTFIVTVS